MSIANPLWGAPRIHGELLKLGIEIGQTSVAKYMVKRREPPSQGWKTFLHNHADGIAAMDLFVVPTISFRLLYGLLIAGHRRRQIVWLGVTAHPTAEWIANQITEAFGWERAPHYLIRDRDRAYGNVFIRRLRSNCAAAAICNPARFPRPSGISSSAIERQYRGWFELFILVRLRQCRTLDKWSADQVLETTCTLLGLDAERRFRAHNGRPGAS